LDDAAGKTRRTQADRREEAEARLLDAAIRLISEKGYDGFSLADVGEAAGFSRGLPAHYFGRKEVLLSRVAQHVVDQYGRSLAQLPRSEPGLPRLAATIRQYARGMASRGNRALGLLVAQAVVEPGLRDTIAELNTRGFAALEAQIRAGIAAGNVAPDVDAPAQARLIYAFLRGQMAFAALDRTYDVMGVAEEFIAMLAERIDAAKG
jgi:TetR/AcrR family acrAB operon transcriptional repressor